MDLIERLRDKRGTAPDGLPSTYGDPVCREAADEIERLRRDVALLLEAIDFAHVEGTTWPSRYALPISRIGLARADLSGEGA